MNAYFVGKPNSLMMRTGLRLLDVHSEDAAIVGDRMDTDIIAGIESGLDTVLVLSGVTRREDLAKYPYRPRHVLNGVGEIPLRDWSKLRKTAAFPRRFGKNIEAREGSVPLALSLSPAACTARKRHPLRAKCLSIQLSGRAGRCPFRTKPQSNRRLRQIPTQIGGCQPVALV